MGNRKIDYTGQKIGKLTILKESEEKINNKPTWECQCECGETIKLNSEQLRRKGDKASCGCFSGRIKDLTGQKFGKLTAIRPTKQRQHNSVVWECLCDCGNITYARAEGLRVGDNTTCGCSNQGSEKFKQRYMVDLTNQTFGKLTVIEATDMRSPKGNQMWKCQCECGNIAYVSTNHLQTGNTKSCGCLQSHSVGEYEIKQILEKNNIAHIQEYIFKDLPNRRYDFAILNPDKTIKYLIEFDGEQHYMEVPYFNTSLKEQQEIDKIKTEHALKNNIPLIRIPYWKRGNITLQDLEVQINE